MKYDTGFEKHRLNHPLWRDFLPFVAAPRYPLRKWQGVRVSLLRARGRGGLWAESSPALQRGWRSTPLPPGAWRPGGLAAGWPARRGATTSIPPPRGPVCHSCPSGAVRVGIVIAFKPLFERVRVRGVRRVAHPAVGLAAVRPPARSHAEARGRGRVIRVPRFCAFVRRPRGSQPLT